MIRTTNPVLKDSLFMPAIGGNLRMTFEGALSKSLLLDLIFLVALAIAWSRLSESGTILGKEPLWILQWVGGGTLAGILLMMVKPSLAILFAPLFCLANGILIACVSSILPPPFSSWVQVCVVTSACVLLASLLGTKLGLARANENLKNGMLSVLIGVPLAYLATFVMHLLGIPTIYIHELDGWGWGVFVLSLLLSGYNHAIDVDYMEYSSRRSTWVHMEWYSGFAHCFMLVWVYPSILLLLPRLALRR
jgi:uncharacterized YccA/Bax inhibitor family protein